MNEQLGDRELVAASLRGDVRAFGRLVEHHHGAVTAVAFAITRDLALAEDIAQDTFVIAWTRLRELRDGDRVRPWLCNIARNKSKNELRGRKHEIAVPVDAIDAKPSVIDAALAREAEAHLRSVLDDMPAAYREPLVLFYWQEQSIASVAAALDISEQAAQKRISRARGYVGEELGARFDEAGRARRPVKAAAAAIVAVLAMRGAPAASAAGLSKAAAIKLFAILAACLAVGIGVWHQTTTRGAAASPTATMTPTAVERAGSTPTTHAARPPVLATAERGSAANGADDGRPGMGGYPVPSSYEITTLAPTSVAVNLAGGTSSTYLFRTPPPPTFDRHVRGRVLDANGSPVAGAAVVVGDELHTGFGSLMGAGGAVTNPSGAFDVVVHTDAALSAIALHPRAGWSAPAAVAAGRGDAEVAIRIAGGGGLSGVVRRGGAPVEANVRIVGDGKLMLEVETDANGRFELPLLAPGRYDVSAHTTQLFAGGTSPGARQTVVVDRATKVTLELPTGALVVVTLREAQALRMVEYFLVPADVKLAATPAFDELRALSRSGAVLSTLFGGQDVDRPMQFHDVAPGEHTLCVDRRIDRDHPMPLLCKKLTVPADKQVVEVEVSGS